MKLGFVLGAALALAPAAALAENQNTQGTQGTQLQNQNTQNLQNPQATSGQTMGDQNMPLKKLLPSDARLIGSVESADVRAFPDQVGTSSQKKAQIQKEDVVGVGAVDNMWATRQPYKTTVRNFDQKLKGEGIEPIAKTTMQSSTAWNVRLPDGHIANVVIRNTQPTTIEAVQTAAVTGQFNEPGTQPAPSSKTGKMQTPEQNQNLNQNPSQNQYQNRNLQK